MPYTIGWMVPGRVCYINCTGVVNLIEARQIVADNIHYIENGERPVHTIIDLTGIEDADLTLSKVPDLFKNEPVNAGLFVMVNMPPYMTVIASVFSRLAGMPSNNLRSVGQAVEIIQKRDNSLAAAQFTFPGA